MKKSLTGMLALLAGAYAVQAQGTVSLANYLNLAVYIYVGYKPLVGQPVLLGGSSAAAPTPTMSNWALETGNGAEWTVALYGAANWNDTPDTVEANGILASSLFAVPGGGAGDTVPGTWNTANFATIPSTAGNGSQVSVMLGAWYNAGGAVTTLAQAMAAGVPWGTSVVENTTSGGPNPPGGGPPATPSSLTNPGGVLDFNVQATPEPSTIALGVIGASTFLMRLRRKQ